MPTPRKGESKRDFINRCIPIVIKEGTARDGAQGNAICNSIWEDDKKKQGASMPKAIDWIFEHQWAITEEALRTIVSIADRERGDLDLILKGDKQVDTEALSARIGQPLEGTQRTVVRDGVAIIPVLGPIFPRANIITMISGATSLEMLAKDFTVAIESEEVHTIVFNIDSPGGEVTGVTELSTMIFEARSTKPIISYVFGRGASAAYWIGSAADKIIVSPTAQVGSIGAIAVIQDTRAREEKAGIKTVEFVSSVSPHKPLDLDTDEGRARVQAVVDTLAGVMVADIARNRGVSEKKVTTDFGKGDIIIGALAVGQGLADSVGSFEQVISEHTTFNLKTEGGSMDLKELKAKHPKLYEQVVAQGKTEAEKANAKAITQAKEEGAQAENERIQGIEKLNASGSEKVIQANKFDRAQTSDTIAAKVLEEQEARAAAAGVRVQTDAKELTDETADLGAAANDPSASEEVDPSLVKAMAKGFERKHYAIR